MDPIDFLLLGISPATNGMPSTGGGDAEGEGAEDSFVFGVKMFRTFTGFDYTTAAPGAGYREGTEDYWPPFDYPGNGYRQMDFIQF